jgi:integrase
MRRLTQRECTRILRTRFTALSQRRLTELKTSELATLLDGIAAPAERRNAFVWLRTFLNWAYSRGYLDTNPITRLKPPPLSRPRERVLSDEEIVKVWHASYSATPPQYGALVRLLMLSLQRKGQWEQFRPEFIHLDKIIFPSEVMKGAREHTIPLTPLIKKGPAAVRRRRALSPGTVMIREWHGVGHQVTIIEKGVLFRGERHRSMSEVARLIIGARWSGPAILRSKGMTAEAPVRHCAVYTRKSSEEGLEQDFNSLHAQREACEAFIRSQRGEARK